MRREACTDETLHRLVEPDQLRAEGERFTRDVILESGNPPGRLPGPGMDTGYIDEISHGPQPIELPLTIISTTHPYRQPPVQELCHLVPEATIRIADLDQAVEQLFAFTDWRFMTADLQEQDDPAAKLISHGTAHLTCPRTALRNEFSRRVVLILKVRCHETPNRESKELLHHLI